MTITLYHCAPSAPSRTALLTARAVGIDVTIKSIDLFAKEQLSPEFLKINPEHTVPTLDDNGFIMWESRAIAAYLVNKYAKNDNLYPKDPQLRAVVDQRLYFDCSTLFPRIRTILFNALFLGESTVPEEKKKSLNDAITLLEKFLNGHKWLASDSSYTVADISTYATLSTIVAVGWDLSSFPNVKSWYEKCKELPGYEENESGARICGELVRSKLEPGQI